MQQKLIEKIKGGSRWTKGEHDRLYFNDSDLGFIYSCYKSSGRIADAEIEEWEDLEGADMATVNSMSGQLSNSQATKIAGCKHYIDLKTDKIESSLDWCKARIEYLILKAKKELEAEGVDYTAEEKPLAADKKVLEDVTMKWLANSPEYIAFSKVWSSKTSPWDIRPGRIFVSTDKKYAIVEVSIFKGLRLPRGTFWRVTIDLVEKRVKRELCENFYVERETGLIDYENRDFCLKREDKYFEEKHEWMELKDDTTPPELKKTHIKKFSVDEAVEVLSKAGTAEELSKVFQSCRKDTLMILARAVEKAIGVHVSSRAGRDTLEKTLKESSQKLLGINFAKCVKNVQLARAVKKWDEKKVLVMSTSIELTLFTKRQLIVIGKDMGLKLSIKMTQSSMISNIQDISSLVA